MSRALESRLGSIGDEEWNRNGTKRKSKTERMDAVRIRNMDGILRDKKNYEIIKRKIF
jgi:hypothetical protein